MASIKARSLDAGSNDDACDGLGSQLTVLLLTGRVYRVRVGGFAGATGNFGLHVEPGTGGGSIATTDPGCGPTTIGVVGEPRIGGTLVTTVGNVATVLAGDACPNATSG